MSFSEKFAFDHYHRLLQKIFGLFINLQVFEGCRLRISAMELLVQFGAHIIENFFASAKKPQSCVVD